MIETLPQEFSRLVGEYQDDAAGDATKAEAWNCIADFAVEHSEAILAALEGTPAKQGEAELLRKARDFIEDEWERDPENAHPNDRSSLRERNALRPELIAELSTALSQHPAPAEVQVKPLEWRDLRGHSFPNMWCASSPCGVYDIEERSASDSPAYVALGPHYSFIADKDSLDEAKAACQADFQKRIRSSLIASPVPAKADGGVTEADLLRLDETLGALEGHHGAGWVNISLEERRLFARLLREHIAALQQDQRS